MDTRSPTGFLIGLGLVLLLIVIIVLVDGIGRQVGTGFEHWVLVR
jgi:hypothetical protein